MVICFDFDGVLTDERIQKLARKVVRERNEVWVVTMRRDNEFNNEILKPILSKIGLTKHSIIFTDEKPKYEFLKGINADIYIDNITDEFEVIKAMTNTIPFLW